MAANPITVMGMKINTIDSTAAKIAAVKYLDSPSAISVTKVCTSPPQHAKVTSLILVL